MPETNLIAGLTDWGAMPTLEATIRFAGQRHRLVAHNIANISTPGFIQLDSPPDEFQRELGRALDDRRGEGGQGPLRFDPSDGLETDEKGDLRIVPSRPYGNILFHDQNNRDIERLMQDQSENLMVYRAAIDLLRSRAEMMRSALAGRV
jgi:flagellar basal-body rod protein FlgB